MDSEPQTASKSSRPGDVAVPQRRPLPDDGLMRQSLTSPYPHPFSDTMEEDDEGLEFADMPRAIVELRMCDLSYQIRQKPDWWEKINNDEIVKKWKAEILATEESLGLGHHKLTSGMVDYVLSELHGYAKLRDPATGIEMACWERVWQSDTLISSELSAQLKGLVKKLENVPEDEKDWHPKSDNQVLDLVHPSLYPVVYGRTLHFNSNSEDQTMTPIKVPEIEASPGTGLSQCFQWLPSDFKINAEGDAQLVSPYINNLDSKKFKESYSIIEQLVGRAVHLWERVLSDFDRPLTPFRFEADEGGYGHSTLDLGCIWGNGDIPYPNSEEDGVDDDDHEAVAAWRGRQEKRLPVLKQKYVHDEMLGTIQKTFSLSQRTIQVIVKLANIHLTPDKPKYAGGSWHIEAMLNERIVSTFIYYYDVDNIRSSDDESASKLSFRGAVREPAYHQQDDEDCMQLLYGFGREDPTVQTRGSIHSSEGRCIAFPNIYQHQVQPFELIDKTKSGHRKIVAFFLVDPFVKIPSATTVPDQHREVYLEAFTASDRISHLPSELQIMIENKVETGMTHEEALKYRLELMQERTGLNEPEAQSGYFSHSFNMW